MTQNQLDNMNQVLEMIQELININSSSPSLTDKLKSRKFWLAVALMIAGICGIIGFSDNITAIVVFAIVEVIAVVGYWISEGGLDKIRAQELSLSIITLIDMVKGDNTNLDEELSQYTDELNDDDDTDCTDSVNSDDTAESTQDVQEKS